MKIAPLLECDQECSCMNCRLKRMETSVDKMQKMVGELKERSAAIRGMPAERNRIRK